MKKKWLIISVVALIIVVAAIVVFLIFQNQSKIFSLESKYYNTGEKIEINISELEELINDKESFVVFVSQDMCLASSNFEVVINDFLEEYPITIYEINYSELKESDLGDFLEHYPSFVIYKNGKVVDFLIANADEDIDYYKTADGLKSWLTTYISLDEVNEYFPVSINPDYGLQDLILESSNDLANIIVYNGCTGSFIDNITRKGKLSQKFTYGIKRDIYGLEATLKFIQINNRNNNCNTQVYLCGVPNFLGLNIGNIINNRLKKVAMRYANVVYVEPVKSKFLYSSIDNGVLKFDIHYDEIEYLEFNNNIIDAINKNYLEVKALIDIDRKLFKYSRGIETINYHLLSDSNLIQSDIIKMIEDEGIDNIYFYNKVKYYLINRFPYDFYYIGKDNICNSITKIYKRNN